MNESDRVESVKSIEDNQDNSRLEWIKPEIELVDLTSVTNAQGGGLSDSGLS